MTASALRSLLGSLLAARLGVFIRPDGLEQPAIWVGEPPSDWRARGLECNIPIIPEIDQTPAHQRGAIHETYRVRLISHGAPTQQHAAVRAMLARWPDAQAREIPADAARGILAQHVVAIPI